MMKGHIFESDQESESSKMPKLYQIRKMKHKFKKIYKKYKQNQKSNLEKTLPQSQEWPLVPQVLR